MLLWPSFVKMNWIVGSVVLNLSICEQHHTARARQAQRWTWYDRRKVLVPPAPPRTMKKLNSFTDNFLLQCRETAPPFAKEKLINFIQICAISGPHKKVNMSDVTYWLWNEHQPAGRIIKRQMNQSLMLKSDRSEWCDLASTTFLQNQLLRTKHEKRHYQSYSLRTVVVYSCKSRSKGSIVRMHSNWIRSVICGNLSQM